MTSTPTEPGTGDPGPADSAAGRALAQALEQVHAGLDALAAVGLVGLGDGETLRALPAVHEILNRLDGLALRVIREVDERQVAVTAGAPSTAAWMVNTCRLRYATARRRVRLASALHTHHADLRSALTTGTISVDHAHVIDATLRALPATTAPALVTDAGALLLTHAATVCPQQLAVIGKHLGTVLDPDGAAAFHREEERLRPKTGLFAADTGTGLMRLSGATTYEQWAWLTAGIDPLAHPVTDESGAADARPLPERRLDALIELVQLALTHPKIPDEGGTRPTLMVTVPLTSLQKNPTLRHLQDLPTLDLDLPTTPTGTPISPGSARRLACDAQLIPLILGTASEPLDVGRATRTIPAALRRAVTHRDRGCKFPGCNRRPKRCHAHHIDHWADGGPTSLPNLVLLCHYHHHLIHQPNNWTLQHSPAGPQFTPPSWIRGP